MFDKEFIDESLGSKSCKLLIVKDSKSEILLYKFLSRYLDSTTNTSKRIIGFDLEFNTPPGSKGQRQIAIFQVSFYLKKYVLTIFFNPKLLESKTNQLIHNLLTNKFIMKIGHGTDSLDIPAIYSYLDDKKKALDFTLGLYDTRFLCEFENIITGSKLCNIYHLLEKFQVVVPSQLTLLRSNESKLGHFWNKTIDLTNLSKELADYSMYDALYLKKLLGQIKKNFKTNKWRYQLVVQTTRLVFLIKREIIEFLDPTFLNLCWIQNNKSNNKLFELFYLLYNEWIGTKTQSEVAIFAIGYFKSQLLKVLIHGFYLLVCIIYPGQIYKSSSRTIEYTQIQELEKSWNNLVINLKLFPQVYKVIINFLKFCKHRL
jgi:hypothetical protein